MQRNYTAKPQESLEFLKAYFKVFSTHFKILEANHKTLKRNGND